MELLDPWAAKYGVRVNGYFTLYTDNKAEAIEAFYAAVANGAEEVGMVDCLEKDENGDEISYEGYSK